MTLTGRVSRRLTDQGSKKGRVRQMGYLTLGADLGAFGIGLHSTSLAPTASVAIAIPEG